MIKELVLQILQNEKSTVKDRRKIREYILQNFSLTPQFLVETSETLTICLESVPIAQIKLRKNSKNLIPLHPFRKIFYEEAFFQKFLNLTIKKYLDSKKANQGFFNPVLESYVNNARQKGASWEYALVEQLSRELTGTIEKTDSYHTIKESFDSLKVEEKESFLKAASVVVNHLKTIEPNLLLPLKINIQKDEAGVKGDVRDIVLSTDSWSLGLSAKNNNEAVKHSRISSGYNFLKEWVGEDCSQEYNVKSAVVFDLLKSHKGKKWDIIFSEKEKMSQIYHPLMLAFKEEIERVSQVPGVCSKLLEYLVGRQAFYKIIKLDKNDSVIIEAFDFKNELNIPHTQVLPTMVKSVRFKENSTSTILVEFDHEWIISFRIHNASGKIESSLKFDISFVNRPFIYRQELKTGDDNG